MSFKVNIVRSDKTALQIASHQGFTGVVEFLLQMGAIVDIQVSLSKCTDQSSSMDQTEKYIKKIDLEDDFIWIDKYSYLDDHVLKKSQLSWVQTIYSFIK